MLCTNIYTYNIRKNCVTSFKWLIDILIIFWKKYSLNIKTRYLMVTSMIHTFSAGIRTNIFEWWKIFTRIIIYSFYQFILCFRMHWKWKAGKSWQTFYVITVKIILFAFILFVTWSKIIYFSAIHNVLKL